MFNKAIFLLNAKVVLVDWHTGCKKGKRLSFLENTFMEKYVNEYYISLQGSTGHCFCKFVGS